MTRLALVFFGGLCVVVATLPVASAKRAPIELCNLISASDLIALGTFVEVSKDPFSGERFAIFNIREVWKGPTRPMVTIETSETLVCDTFEVTKGQTGVVFITYNESDGTGRPVGGSSAFMRLERSHGKAELIPNFVVIRYGCIPDGDVSWSDGQWLEWVSLTSMKALVREQTMNPTSAI